METAAKYGEIRDFTNLAVIRNNLRNPDWITYIITNGSDSIKDLDLLVCDIFKVDEGALLTRTRKREIKDARFVYFYVMNQWFGYSLKSIERITEWSHSDIKHGIGVIQNFIDTEYTFRQKIIRLKSVIDQSIIRAPLDPKIEENAHNLIYQRRFIIQTTTVKNPPNRDRKGNNITYK